MKSSPAPASGSWGRRFWTAHRARVALTDAGSALLPRARATLDAARAAREAVEQVRGGLRGTLRIGTMTSVEPIDLPALLGAFRRLHPLVAMRLVVDPQGTQGLLGALEAARLDLAFVGLPGPAPAGIALHHVASVPLDLVVPAGHRLAARSGVRLRDLEGETFVDFPAGYGNRLSVDAAFAAAGIERAVGLEVPDVAATADFVRHGLGIAILPRPVIPPRPDLRTVPLRDASLRWPLAAATSTTRATPAPALALLELVDRYVAPVESNPAPG